jgi:hypothetical protein
MIRTLPVSKWNGRGGTLSQLFVWALRLSVLAVPILCWTVVHLLTSTSTFEQIRIPAANSLDDGGRRAPAVSSKQNNAEPPRFRQAFEQQEPPIFTRIAAISPALLALPRAEPDESASLAIAMGTPSDSSEIDLPRNAMTDESDSHPLPSFVGIWAPTSNACSPRSNSRDLLPAVINKDGAWAGDVTCRFRRIRQSGNVAVATSTCSNGRDRWTAKVRLAVAGDRLIWSSERGSQTYIRCAPQIAEAHVRI